MQCGGHNLFLLVEIADLSKSGGAMTPSGTPGTPGSDRPIIVASSDSFFLEPTPSHRSVVRFNSGSTLLNKGQRFFYDIQTPKNEHKIGRLDQNQFILSFHFINSGLFLTGRSQTTLIRRGR